MIDPAAEATSRDVVCPFCGLGCDDVALKIDGAAVTAVEGACGRAAALFARSGAPAPAPRVNGREASLEEAIAAATELLSLARAPAYGGLGTDVNGVRALIKLAGRTGGGLDHYASAGLFRNLQTSQRKGWISTTLAEVRNRCDLLLIVGPDPAEDFHRLYDRVLPPSGKFAPASREVVFLGGAPGGASSKQLEGRTVEVVPTAEGGLVDALSQLSASLLGALPAGARPIDGVAALADRLKAAKYAVVAWNAAALGDDGDLIVERCSAVVDALNVTTRAGCLPLTGRDNLMGGQQTLLWNVGFPLRTGFKDGVADHDQTAYAGDVLLRAADVAVWVSAFRPQAAPETGGSLIALAHPETDFEREPDVFIPVGQPGLDHAGHAFRTDVVVCLPLSKHRESGLPAVAEVVARIAKGLEGARR